MSKNKKSIEGVLACVPTVFNKNRELDLEGFKKNIRYLEDVGMHGIVVASEVGEFMSIETEDFDKVVSTAVDTCQKMTCVIGCGYQNVRGAIRRIKYAEDAGADGAMIWGYHYTWRGQGPLDDKVYHLYRLLHKATSEIQMMVFNYPPQMRDMNISPDAFGRLLEFDRVVAAREPVFDTGEAILQETELIRRYGDRLNVLSVCEAGLYAMMMIGGKGCVAIYGLAMPQIPLGIYNAVKKGDTDTALTLHKKLCRYPWVSNKPFELFPGTIVTHKAMVEAAGHKAGPPRLPYLPPSPEMRETAKNWLKDVGAQE
jgi:4-hydroxy-tetrahydrodipicolinate synthase